ncbi:glucan endo-1 3-beta-glucosidase [Phtheirospermum japonicum]|uniref:Glucan endo-1 3-beta-glucosidase n=1 Tax=Phtheirospermum japonicum TaxID=374723 RepID=A0A830BSY2_9LAMI|nr:glucan endo-1 3-beta-glucosidase [Phtheirospermum japonicum]
MEWGAPIGVCYGRVATNLPRPSAVIKLLKSNGISRIRLFNPDPDALTPFYGTGIDLMIGVPNEILPMLGNGSIATSLQWLQSNIFSHVAPHQVRYLVVGNEVLLKQPYYMTYLVPAILNLYQALQTLGLGDIIKISSAHAAPILSTSYPPSAGAFDPDLGSVLLPLLRFLRDTGSPLMVNIYPFFSYIDNSQYVSLDYALFRSTRIEVDQNLTYTNMFDEAIDAFVYAMEREGFYGIPVVVTETGWPTGGGDAAGADNALAYNGNVVMRTLGNVGTPKRPGVGVEVFLFDLFDENGKSGDEYEKHFGIFGGDGIKAYDIRLSKVIMTEVQTPKLNTDNPSDKVDERPNLASVRSFFSDFSKRVLEHVSFHHNQLKSDDRITKSTLVTWSNKDSSTMELNLERQLKAWKDNPNWVDQPPDIKVTIPKGSLSNLSLTVDVGLPPDAIYNIVTDPDNKRVFKNIKEVISRKVLVDEGSRQVVEVEQAAIWRFLWLSGTISVHVLVDQNRQDYTVRT